MEKRYYQYLIGENRGSVVSLTEIDDTLSDMILYIFDDGFKCNEDLIAPINQWDVKGKIMAQVDSPSNIWKFTEKEIVPETKEASGKDGQMYEAADPYFFDKNGNSVAKAKKEIKMDHPRRTTVPEKITNNNSFYRSLKDNPNVENSKVPTENPGTSNNTSDASQLYSAEEVQELLKKMGVTPVKQEGNLDVMIVNVSQYKFPYDDDTTVRFVDSDKNSDSFKLKDIVKLIKENLSDEKTEQSVNTTYENEATVLYNKCSKEEAEVTLKIVLDLPSVELFKSIQDNYPEGWGRMFIENAVNNIETEELKSKLVDSLFNQYSGLSEK